MNAAFAKFPNLIFKLILESEFHLHVVMFVWFCDLCVALKIKCFLPKMEFTSFANTTFTNTTFQRVAGQCFHLPVFSKFCVPEAKFCVPEAKFCLREANSASGKQNFASGKQNFAWGSRILPPGSKILKTLVSENMVRRPVEQLSVEHGTEALHKDV